ncbi:FMN-dependent NADH-azoreductase [Nannocystis exedens]|uniref:FMN dependent NADH:quinone oxidoreductase n=1 Tax=Nannocystis exedens TaxID=54 RepID=A0A1I1ZR93_9BACT|nr:NAD(P)H-dependent oxidoreductase [Nannocystis exedens]PCC75358.1 FMN-dependent NADH-azoreductase [Nannocystis exedens]SFE34165.1 FMN-dependent NADH-azoreductase [Nannocystis exedens]
MTTLLRIDASARFEGSSSRRLADHFEARWRATHPGAQVIVRDLARTPVPHVDGPTIAAFYGAPVGPDRPAGVALSDALIAELRAADHLLVSSPLYNQSLPSTLKAWIDHVVREGHTFVTRDRRPVGLLDGTSASIVIARGGVTSARVDDFETPYLRAILGFVGITRVEVITVEGTAHDEATRSQRFAAAQAQVDRLFGGRA